MIRSGTTALLLALLAGAAPAQELPPVFETRPEAPEAEEAEEPADPFEDRVETDRSAFTPAPTVVGPGRAVLELSGSYLDFRSGPGKYSYPEALLRIGVGERFEARAGYNIETTPGYQPGEAGTDIAGTTLGVGREQFLYGFKYQVTRQAGLLPTSGFLVQGYTPVAGTPRASQMAAGYVVGWKLPNHWHLDAAARFATNREGEDGYQTWAASSVLRVPVARRGEFLVEYFGVFSDGKEEDFVRQYAGTGFTWLVTPDLEVGVRTGAGLNERSPAIYANVGLGWRFGADTY